MPEREPHPVGRLVSHRADLVAQGGVHISGASFGVSNVCRAAGLFEQIVIKEIVDSQADSQHPAISRYSRARR